MDSFSLADLFQTLLIQHETNSTFSRVNHPSDKPSLQSSVFTTTRDLVYPPNTSASDLGVNQNNNFEPSLIFASNLPAVSGLLFICPETGHTFLFDGETSVRCNIDSDDDDDEDDGRDSLSRVKSDGPRRHQCTSACAPYYEQRRQQQQQQQSPAYEDERQPDESLAGGELQSKDCPLLHSWHRESFLLLREYFIVVDEFRITPAPTDATSSDGNVCFTLHFRLRDATVFYHPFDGVLRCDEQMEKLEGDRQNVMEMLGREASCSCSESEALCIFTPLSLGSDGNLNNAVLVEGWLWYYSQTDDILDRDRTKTVSIKQSVTNLDLVSSVPLLHNNWFYALYIGKDFRSVFPSFDPKFERPIVHYGTLGN